MTTSAVNENRRPPLTTLATRLISTTRSFSSRESWISTLLMSELESSLAGGVGERLHPAVVEVAAAIEHRGRDLGLLRARDEQLADLRGLRGLVALERLLQLQPARRGERAALPVVHELGGDAPVRAVDDETGPLGRAADLPANAPVAAVASLSDGERGHQARLPAAKPPVRDS